MALLFFLYLYPAAGLAAQEDPPTKGSEIREGELQKALSLFGEGKLDEAMNLAKHFDDEHPRSLESKLLLGRIYLVQAYGITRYTGFAGYFRRDLLGEAEEWFRRALEIDAASIEVRNYLAFTLLLLMNVPAARDEVERVLDLDNKNAYALYLMGEIHLIQGNAAASIRHFQESLAIEPKSAEARAGLIRAFTAEGERKKAAEEMSVLLESNPDLPDALTLAFDIYEALELLSEAVVLYRTLLDVAPQRLDIMFQWGSVEYRLGNLDAAERLFDTLLEKKHDHDGALYYKGCLLIDRGRVEEAAPILERAARQQGTFFSYALDRIHAMALYHAGKNRYEPAFKLFDLILELNHADSVALANKALGLSKAGRIDEADKAFRELMELEPWDSSIVNNYALHLFGTRRTEEGLAMLHQAVKIDGNPDALENIGSYYFYSEPDLGKADDRFRDVLKSVPDRTKSLVLREYIAIRRRLGRD